MKLGTENKKQTAIALGLAAFAAWFAIHQFTSDSGAAAAPAAPVAANSAPEEPGVAQRTTVTPRSQRKNSTITLPTGAPGLRLDLLKLSEQIAYNGNGRNIFQDEPIKVVEKIPDPRTTAPPPPPAPANTGPPPPPPINLKFFGFANRPGQARQVFLAEGDDTFIAREGDIVDRRYKVLKINNDSVEIQDMLNNNTQRILMTQ
ncbi:MAG: hypothetical protein JO041_05855 [Acidobacteria bacterium]|nr:hypothetical protein [Acidobacteriota bacterium]